MQSGVRQALQQVLGGDCHKESTERPCQLFFQGCYHPEFEAEISKCKEKCFAYNKLSPNDREAQQKLLSEILGHMGDNAVITPPFWCDYGYHISVGDYCYSNHN